MNPPATDADARNLSRQREDLRRNFRRANATVAVILFALLTLAIAAVVADLRAGHNLELAQAAGQERQEQLAQALRAQAGALRLSGQVGRRFLAIQAISNAVALGPTPELRAEAIACLALNDLATLQVWPETRESGFAAIDATLEHLAFSDDGRHLTIRDATAPANLCQFDLASISPDPEDGYLGLTFSPDGRYLGVRLASGGLLALKTDSAQIAFAALAQGAFSSRGAPAFTADGRWLYFMQARPELQLQRAELQTGTITALPFTIPADFSIFRVDPLGRRAAVAHHNLIEVWNLADGTRERTLSTTTPVASMVWSNSGRQLAASGFNGEITVWEVPGGAGRQLLGHTAGVKNLVFSGDGERLGSACGDGTSRLWEVRTGRVLVSMPWQVMQLDATGNRLAYFQRGVGLSLSQVVPAVGSRILHTGTEFRGEGWKSDLSPDGRWLAWAEPDALHVWDLNSPRPPLILPMTNLYTVFWHPREPRLFLATQDHLESRGAAAAPEAAEVGVSLGPPQPLALPAKLHPVMAALSANAQTLAAIDVKGTLWIGRLDDPASFVQATNVANPSGPFGSGSLTGSGRLALSPDGKWVATVDMLNIPAPHIFDALTGRLVTTLPTATGTVGFSPDGRWLATGGKAEIALWSVGPWLACWHHPRSGLATFESGVAFSSDSSLLAVGDSPQLTALLDRGTGRELAEFTPPDDSVSAEVRWGAASHRLVVPTLNSSVLVWDLDPIRAALATLGLDWEQPGRPKPPGAPPSAGSTSTGAILLGLACVTPAAGFALWSLRRHRQLLQEFVQSQAEAQRRTHELAAAKIELLQSQKMRALGTLAAGIAHDFNNLLSVIRMSNKLIGRATKSDPEVAEEVASIEKAVQRGKHVVGSMLGYSRGQPGDHDQCDLNEAVEETVALLTREFLSGIQLTLALNRQVPRVRIARGRLEQMLLNLVVNAAEAMKGQGKLELAVDCRPAADGDFLLRPTPAADLVELRVTDSGPGIPPEILPRIFEPFFTTKSAGVKQGTGLGLSLVYSIAEQDGVGIAVESRPGRGAAFRLFLPTDASAQSPRPNPTLPPPGPGA